MLSVHKYNFINYNLILLICKSIVVNILRNKQSVLNNRFFFSFKRVIL